MSQDVFYARVDQVTSEILETLSRVAPGLNEVLATGQGAIQEAGTRHLPAEQRTGLVNLSFFYLLATTIDFLFFLHQRRRGVEVYEHELEHVFGVLLGHAERQRAELAAGPAHSHAPDQVPADDLGLAAFEREIARLRARLGGTDA